MGMFDFEKIIAGGEKKSKKPLFDVVFEMFDDATSWNKTLNYYFVDHQCSKSDETIRVRLNITLRSDLTGELVRIGACEKCGAMFYHETFGRDKERI